MEGAHLTLHLCHPLGEGFGGLAMGRGLLRALAPRRPAAGCGSPPPSVSPECHLVGSHPPVPSITKDWEAVHPVAGFDCSLCFQDPFGVMASLQTVFLLVCGWVCSLVHSRERGRHHLHACAVRTCWVRAQAPSALWDSVTGDRALETVLNLTDA